jgi:hypothetical protein
MKQDREEISWPLRCEDQAARYAATPIRSVTVEPLSRGPHHGDCCGRAYRELDARHVHACVPATLVDMDKKCLFLSRTNFCTQVLHIGSDMPLAALENFDSVQKILGLPDQENSDAAVDIAERDLPEHLQTLFERSLTDLPEAGDCIAI